MRRRSFLEALAVGGLGLAVAPGALAVDDVAPRLVVVILRGGLDGLALAPPHGDPGYRSVRGGLALPAPGTEGGIVDLDGTFGLHPALAPLAPLYGQGELVVVHAASVPYDRRSHFDGQDVLENGTAIPFGERTGWLSRALALSEEAPAALAVGRTIPLLLRGPARAASADLTRRPRTDPWLQRVQQLYLDDPQLGPALEEGLEIQALLARHGAGASLVRRRSSLETELEGVAQLLGALDGPRTVVLELGGWDTHTGQLTSLSRQLERLALGMIALKRAIARGELDPSTDLDMAMHMIQGPSISMRIIDNADIDSDEIETMVDMAVRALTG